MNPSPTSNPLGPASAASVPSPPSLGPIARVPPEILLTVLNSLLAPCPTPLGRQAEAQRFLRVSQAFHSAYLLSSAVHECAVSSATQARMLATKLQRPENNELSIHSLSVEVSLPGMSGPVGDVLSACGASLRVFVCDELDGETIWWDKIIYPFADALAQCVEMEVFSLKHTCECLYFGCTQTLLEAWPKLRRLNLNGCYLFLTPPHSDPTAWRLPISLTSLELLLCDSTSLDLFAALIQASATTLRHVGLAYTDCDYDRLAACFKPVTPSLVSLRMRQYDDADCDYDAIPPVLGVLPKVREIELPVEAIAEEAVAAALIKYESLDSLFLDTHLGDANAAVNDVVELVKVVKVGKLNVGEDWWRRQAETEMAQVDGDYPTLMTEWMQARAAEVEVLVGSLSFV